jgi:drug/metabolite transporter (DMT)-like permease
MYPIATALITAVVHPLRRYALIQSHEPLFFTAVVGPVSLLALAAYYVTPLCNEKLVWDRRAFWPFLVSGFFETLAVLLMLLAFSLGPVVVVSPIASTTPIWTLIISANFSPAGGKNHHRQCRWHTAGCCRRDCHRIDTLMRCDAAACALL